MTQTQILQYLSSLNGEDFQTFLETANKERWINTYKFPENMYEWFRAGISKHRGDAWENKFIKNCISLGLKTDANHDATLDANLVAAQNLKGKTIEIKFFTMLTGDSAKQIQKRGYALPWGERAFHVTKDKSNITGWAPPKKGTWQQVKPSCAHYGLFSALYGDGAIHYWVPYHLISRKPGKRNVEPGMIPMGIQHRDHELEGQIDVKSRFHELFFLDATVGTPFIADLSKYDLSKYDNLVY